MASCRRLTRSSTGRAGTMGCALAEPVRPDCAYGLPYVASGVRLIEPEIATLYLKRKTR